MKQLTQEQAIELNESLDWSTWTPRQIVAFQLFQGRLCMPFDVFHEAIEEVLGRPVFDIEFVHADLLRKEYLTMLGINTQQEDGLYSLIMHSLDRSLSSNPPP